MAVTQQLPSHLLTQHTIDLRRGGGGGLRSLAAFTGRSCIRPGNRPSSGIWNLACPALRGRTSWHSVRRLLVRPDQVPTGDRAGFQNRNISRVARPGSGLRSFRSRDDFVFHDPDLHFVFHDPDLHTVPHAALEPGLSISGPECAAPRTGAANLCTGQRLSPRYKGAQNRGGRSQRWAAM